MARTRLAVLGARHWHAPLFMAGLDQAGAEVGAVWDEDAAVALDFAAAWGGRAVDTPAGVLAEPVDVALVLGAPAAMPSLAAPFVERGTPVILEKPGAARLADLSALRALAGRTGTPVAVPLVQRFAGVGRALLDLAAGERMTSASFTFVAGGPERYRRAGCGFMLDPALAGGGAMLNLGVHFVDLAMALAGGEAVEAHGLASHALHGEAVEDHAVIAMRFAQGAIATVEAGYGFPDHPQRRLFTATVATDRSFMRFDGRELRVIDRAGGERTVEVDAETDRYYADFLADALDAFRSGRAPAAGLAEMEAAFAVVARALSAAPRGFA